MDDEFSVRSVTFEFTTIGAGGVERLAEPVGEKMFGTEVTGGCIIAGPTDDDRLVVDVARPFAGIADLAADMVVDLVAVRVD